MGRLTDISKGMLNTLPEGIAILFGDPVGKIAGIAGVTAKAFNHLSQKNKDWWSSYLTALEVIDLVYDEIQSAEYIQFLRKVILQVAFETRERKRNYLLNTAINYHKGGKIPFDRKVYFLDILDKISIEELGYLLFVYDKTDIYPFKGDPDLRLSVETALAGYGLLTPDYDEIQTAIDGISVDIDGGREADVTPGSFTMVFVKTKLGKEFVEFILKDNAKRGIG